MHSHLPIPSSPDSSPARAQRDCDCTRLCSGLGACRCSWAPSAHRQRPWREPARHPPQPLLSSQTLKSQESRARQPAGGQGPSVSLPYLPGRQHAHRSDWHRVQILSKAVAAALGALVPGDGAKACVKQFRAPTRPEFNGAEKALANQVPWQGPTSSACCPSHATPALVPPALLTSAGLRWKGPTLPPGFQNTRSKGQEESARYACPASPHPCPGGVNCSAGRTCNTQSSRR